MAAPSPQALATPDAELPGVGAILDLRLADGSDAPVAVAFSGGGDSLALLLAASAWAVGADRRILALSVDHGLLPQSADWSRMAQATAARLGVGFQALEWRGPKPATGLAAAARRARHALIAEAARQAGARVILFGHTLDDQREAVLMRQGGSTLGLSKEWSPSPVWPEGRGLFLLRPMLDLRRATLRAWLADKGFPWIEDPANDDVRSARARARRALALCAAHPREREDERGLRALALSSRADAHGVISIPRTDLTRAPADLARRFIGLACVCAGGGERRPRTERLERLRARIAGGKRFTACLAGARVEAGETIRILRDAGEAARGGLAPIALEPGRPAVWDGRFEAQTDRAGVTIGALRGRMSQLAPAERAALKAAPPLARPGLPAITRNGEAVTCPILAQGSQVRVRCLVGERLGAACGVITHEEQTQFGANGEPEKNALS